MPRPRTLKPTDFTVPIIMNGLQGRMLRLPPPPRRKRHILLVYGAHSNLERLFSFAQVLNRFGSVSMPDLPGFGGMQSFYKLNEKPSLDNLADYLAAFIKLRYRQKKVTIVGFSTGFIIATRMLQKYPDLAKKVDLLVSVIGFVHKEDLKLNPVTYWSCRLASNLLSKRLPAWLTRTFLLHKPTIKLIYALATRHQPKKRGAPKKPDPEHLTREVELWKKNNFRTYMYSVHELLKLNLCKSQIKVPLYHLAVDRDRYFDNQVLKQHLKVIFPELHVIRTKLQVHMPTAVATAQAITPVLPLDVQRLLARSPKP